MEEVGCVRDEGEMQDLDGKRLEKKFGVLLIL